MKTKDVRNATCAIGSAIVFGLIAGFQIIGTSRDYDNYLTFFSWINGSTLTDALSYRFEPGFGLLAYYLSNTNLTGAGVYALIAGICMLLKVSAIGNTKNYWVVLIIFFIFYLSRYFTLFEMTVLRATAALSLGFFVFLKRDTAEIKILEIVLLLIAISMHFSAFIFLAIYTYTPKNRLVASLIALNLFISVFFIKNLALTFLPNYIFVFGTYENLTESSTLPKPMLVDIAFLCFMIYNWKHNDFQMKVAVYGILIGLALHFSLLEYSLIASRFRELLSIFFIVYVVRAINHKGNTTRFAAVLFALISGSIHLYTTYIHDPLLT